MTDLATAYFNLREYDAELEFVHQSIVAREESTKLVGARVDGGVASLLELDQAKTGVIRWLPEQFETIGSTAATIASNWAQGLPLSELQGFSDRVAAVTLDQVNAAARKYARNDQALFLLVRDREKIEPQLRDFR